MLLAQAASSDGAAIKLNAQVCRSSIAGVGGLVWIGRFKKLEARPRQSEVIQMAFDHECQVIRAGYK